MSFISSDTHITRPVVEELMAYAESIPAIDTHEHFISERAHLKRYLSFFDYLASYVKSDLASSGAPYNCLDYPGDEKQAVQLWELIAPYWENVRCGSYARPVLLSLKKYHGCDQLTRETVIQIGRELNEQNQPGHYDAVFDDLKIEKIINQSICGEILDADRRFCYGIPVDLDPAKRLGAFLNQHPQAGLEEYLAVLDAEIQQEVQRGAVLQKFFADMFLQERDVSKAHQEFEAFKRHPEQGCGGYLIAGIAHHRLDVCAKYGIVAAVHTGVWGNVTRLSPSLLFPVVDQHWNTRFDIYHLGIPYCRECIFLGKNYPHVYLNLCWAHCVSERITREAIHEIIDLVPVNKIFGFGGDVNTLPEQVYGQLAHAQENLAMALAERIQSGRMDLAYAKHVLKLWLSDNPRQVYHLT